MAATAATAPTDVIILNPSDKTRFYSYASGKGAPTDGVLCEDTHTYPIGSLYLDIAGKKMYVRIADNGVKADWNEISTSAQQ